MGFFKLRLQLQFYETKILRDMHTAKIPVFILGKLYKLKWTVIRDTEEPEKGYMWAS